MKATGMTWTMENFFPKHPIPINEAGNINMLSNFLFYFILFYS